MTAVDSFRFPEDRTFFGQLQANSDADSVECRNLINRHIYAGHILLRVIWHQRSISRNHYTAPRSNVTSGTMKILFRCADRHFWSLLINLTSSRSPSGSPASVSWWLYIWKSWSRLLPAYILLLSRSISLSHTNTLSTVVFPALLVPSSSISCRPYSVHNNRSQRERGQRRSISVVLE